MRPLPGIRRGLVLVLGFTATAFAACSKTPTYVNDQAGGSGGFVSSSGTGASSSSSTTTSSSSSTSGGDAGRPCLHVADCGALDLPCAHAVCEQGICGVSFDPAGTALKAQVPGDCKRRVCDGAGDVTAEDDDADLPDDGNACTVDSCAGGVPAHAPAMMGASCGSKPNMTCDGAGHCVGCTNESHCGAAGACFSWSCDTATNTCEQVFTAANAGSPSGGAAGDCQRNVCDGMGGVIVVALSTDVPPSPSPCLVGACNGDVPTLTPAPEGVSCYTSTCDGMGQCGACTVDADCGAGDACATPRCVGGHCSAIFADAGTVVPQQTDGDCKTAVCDGSGHMIGQAEPTDVPADPDLCTTGGCNGSTPTFTPKSVPVNSNPCLKNSCDPVKGIVSTPLPDGTSCGGCSTCQQSVCTDPCPALNCVCVGTTCGSCM